MKEAEEIIRTKNYFELSPAELEIVSEYASSEEDYEAMKWFLLSTQTAARESEIVPSGDLRKGVMAHLAQKQPAPKMIWLNSVGAFLFPAEKKMYQYPALQLAAVALLLIGVVFVYNGANINQQDLALNSQEQVSPSQDLAPLKEEASEESPALIQNEIDGLKAEEQKSQLQDNKDMDMLPVSRNLQNIGPLEQQTEEKIVSGSDDELSSAVPYYYAGDVESPDQNVSVGESKEQLSDLPTVTGKSEVAKTERDKMKNKKESQSSDYRSEAYKKQDLDEEKTVTVSPGASNGAITSTTKGEADGKDKDTERYNTATAGGVYGTVGYTQSPDVTDQTETIQGAYSVSETKVLKKLIFVIK